MTSTSKPNITELLLAWNNGDQEALQKLIPLVEAELRKLARKYMKGEQKGHVMQPTALINEVYLRLIKQLIKGERTTWENRAHFFGVSATIMRHILVDIGRRRQRKGENWTMQQSALDETPERPQESRPDLVALDDALKTLDEIGSLKSRIVELRFFGGLTLEEVAEVLNIHLSKAKREWLAAKAWLYRELSKK